LKKTLGVIIIICLLLATYHYQPQIEEKMEQHWGNYIDDIFNNDRLTEDEKQEDLLILSLNLRGEKKPDLAFQALHKADSVETSNQLIDGIKGLYYLEIGDNDNAIKSWQVGAASFSDDSNLSYLATLTADELEFVDNHMLEKMFVDTIINAGLTNPLYHKFDDELLANTEKKIRLADSIDQTFAISSIASLFVLLYSIFRIKKALKNRALKKLSVKPVDDKQEEKEPKEDSSESSVSKPVKYMIAISSILKIGQVLASLFNYFMLGTDISDFVSGYVFTPTNLVSLFTDNILFAGIFLTIMAVEFYRRKIMVR